MGWFGCRRCQCFYYQNYRYGQQSAQQPRVQQSSYNGTTTCGGKLNGCTNTVGDSCSFTSLGQTQTPKTANDLYTGNAQNSNGAILRSFAGSSQQLLQQCQQAGAQQGAQDGASIGTAEGSKRGLGGPITQMARNIGYRKGYQQGYQQGWQSGTKVGNGLNAAIDTASGIKLNESVINKLPSSIQTKCRNFMNDESNLNDKNKCLEMGIEIAKAIDEESQQERAQAYKNYGYKTPEQQSNQEIQKLITGMEKLKDVPEGVTKAIADLPVDKAKNVLEQLNDKTQIQQATVLAKECPEALTAALDSVIDNLGTDENQNVKNANPQQKTLLDDLKENGKELFDAINDNPQLLEEPITRLESKINSDENIQNKINEIVENLNLDEINISSDKNKNNLVNQAKEFITKNESIKDSLSSLCSTAYKYLSSENRNKLGRFLRNTLQNRFIAAASKFKNIFITKTANSSENHNTILESGYSFLSD